MKYEEMKNELVRLANSGKIPSRPTREQRVDFAYGNAKIENDRITRELTERATDNDRRTKDAK